MKHENSNASTSSTGTPPTPTASAEINGNVNPPSSNNTNYNFQIQPIVEGINSASTGENMAQNVWNNQVSSPHQIQHPINHQQQQQHHHQQNPQHQQPESQINYGNRMPTQAGNSEYVHYAVNEQYSNKFDVQTITPSTNQHVSYDSWMVRRKLGLN
jgi:hypothetical protein